MSTAKRPHPLLAPALLISHLETETLEALLGEVVRVVNEANLRVEKLSSDWELRSQKGEDGLRKLAHTVEAKLESWSERFTELERKHYELSTDFTQRIADLERQLKTQTDHTTEDYQRQMRLLGKEVKERQELLEDQVLRVKMDLNALHVHKESESITSAFPVDRARPSVESDSPTLSPPSAKDDIEQKYAMRVPERVSETIYLAHTPDPKVAQMESRLAEVESRLSSLQKSSVSPILPAVPAISVSPIPPAPTIMPAAISPEVTETKIRISLMQEIEYRHQSLLREVADLRSSFLESLKLTRADSLPEMSAVQKEMEERVCALEDAVGKVRKRMSLARAEESSVIQKQIEAWSHPTKDDLPELTSKEELEAFGRAIREELSKFQVQLYILNESVRNMSPSTNFVPMLEDIERLKLVATRTSEEVQFLASTLQNMKSVEKSHPEKPLSEAQESAAITYRLSALLVATKSLSLGSPSKVLTESRSTARAATHHPTTVPYTAHLELLQGFEVQLNGLRHDLEKLKIDVSSRDRELNEVNQHFERLENLFQGSMERMQIDVNQKMENVMELLDRPADHPDATKNLTALRGVILRLQKEVRDLAAVKPSVPEPPAECSSPSKSSYSQIYKLEGQIKALEGRFSQITSDLEVMHLWVKKSVEAQGTARLAEMESFKTEIGGVVNKVMDGVKLNKRDFENLSELYEKLDQKGDKVELAQKVDKVELRKAYIKLQSRIEAFRDDLKHITEPPALIGPEEAAASTRRIDTGCLSCGQGVSSIETEREWRHKTQFPSRSRLNRYGHGFSKLLPMLDSLVSPKSMASDSGRGNRTERTKLPLRRFPDSYTSFSGLGLHTPTSSHI